MWYRFSSSSVYYYKSSLVLWSYLIVFKFLVNPNSCFSHEGIMFKIHFAENCVNYMEYQLNKTRIWKAVICCLTNFNFLQHNAEPEAVDLLMEVICQIFLYVVSHLFQAASWTMFSCNKCLMSGWRPWYVDWACRQNKF